MKGELNTACKEEETYSKCLQAVVWGLGSVFQMLSRNSLEAM